MQPINYPVGLLFFSVLVLSLSACKRKNDTQATQLSQEIDLKRGEIVLCGPLDKQVGTVAFINSCSEKTEKEFNLGIALLHSFEYDEAEKVFAKVIDNEPDCAMAYWGVAMCNYHQVWPSPPSEAELKKGVKAISLAKSLPQKSQRETDYINAMAVFYQDWPSVAHRARSLNFTRAMATLHKQYPADKEAAIFYALALVGSADITDKSFSNQKKAAAILTGLYPGQPNHPGIVHYIIHSYDSPELAALALPAARKYASIAPSSAHALHMPSHIFTRLGLWDEAIRSNLMAASSAKCYAQGAGIKGHWDEELHALDYLVYSYLQTGQNTLAKKQLDYLKSFDKVSPANFKVAYAFAAIPARYFLENRLWQEAAGMELHPATFPWQKFPWQKAIFHFARLLGAVHIDAIDRAKTELKSLHRLQDSLTAQKDAYKANQVAIQIKAGEAWIAFREGRTKEALLIMQQAADMEDKTEKSPVTPGEILPASELLGDLLLQLNKPAEALVAYESDLKKHPGRFNGLSGAGLASERLNKPDNARVYYRQLTALAKSTAANRPELERARAFLATEN